MKATAQIASTVEKNRRNYPRWSLHRPIAWDDLSTNEFGFGYITQHGLDSLTILVDRHIAPKTGDRLSPKFIDPDRVGFRTAIVRRCENQPKNKVLAALEVES